MAVADYFGLHCCRPAAFMQRVSSGVGDTGTGSRNWCQYQARAQVPVQYHSQIMAGYCTGTRVHA